MRKKLPHFLADTWWYAITKRLKDEDFLKLVKIRQSQGFTAAQIVVGIPPEVGIEDENTKSIYGSAFDKKGNINYKYLEFARKRIEIMNKHNLIAIVYGAWGNQINWIGYRKMQRWWKELIKVIDDLEVMYCLTGEIDIKATSKKLRIRKWTKVLKCINRITEKPIIVHTMPESSAYSLIKNHDLISANTFQTGHDKKAEKQIWERINIEKRKYPNVPIVNLEPFYEGMHNQFSKKEQIEQFKKSVKLGAHAICYGAQGIWNVGDGKFLSHWGTQTFDEALKLETPEILGKEYKKIYK